MNATEYVGILVNDSLYRGIPRGATGHEALGWYEEAGAAQQLTPCYFRLKDIQVRAGTVRAYVRQEGRYVRRRVRVPQVIHNRAIYFTRKARHKLSRLERSGRLVFNGWNRHSKLLIHQIMMENEALRPHLPATEALAPDHLRGMMDRYDSLILKPASSSIGRGVMKLEREDEGEWALTWRNKGRLVRHRIGAELPLSLMRKLQARRYVVQQRLPLALLSGRPFDLRVSVQRAGDGAWTVTGIVAKVAAPDAFVTNVAQGGSVRQLDAVMADLAEADLEQTRIAIEQFALRAAEHLSSRLPHLADVGFDIGLTETGFPMFIECNGRDQRYSFQKGGMPAEWRATFANPIAYARYLLDARASERREAAGPAL
ncbi:YheC/YheD family endospore coat-associated protein [Paenibacillus sabuli]|uniref:YheC/YheD family endospore coat-associated protein n=1 Tax=Paenibacillus sabuli TaxID=2772509 RepID=UPI00295B04F8|nr:YheC/YheD family protein [Paenibacillus sabuli]